MLRELAVRRWVTEPLLPLVLLGAVAVWSGGALGWTVVGGLAGYSLSGSV